MEKQKQMNLKGVILVLLGVLFSQMAFCQAEKETEMLKASYLSETDAEAFLEPKFGVAIESWNAENQVEQSQENSPRQMEGAND